MFIKNIKLKNFRNYNDIDINLDKEINIFYGNNAEGKTNFLESIYICSTTKSYKNVSEREIIKFEEKESHIKIILYKENLTKKENAIDIQINKERKKGIALNGVKIDKASEYIGFFTVVLFAPEDLNIIREGPSARRKFLDIEMCQIDKIYVNVISKYKKILNERNVVLKDIKESTGANKNDLLFLLDTYDEQIATYGIEIIKKRKKNIEELKKFVKDLYINITEEKEKIEIFYENDLLSILKEEEKAKEVYLERLKEDREKDIKNCFTSFGPHRDDIKISIDDSDLRKFGSQGQKKTAAICLKLAELNIIKEKNNEMPVLLLDDVFSELDENRQMKLISNIKGIQTIITCTGMKKNIFELLRPNKIFQVIDNKIIEKSK